MRLLRAELRKLNRPLAWGVAGTAAVFCVLLAIGGAANASNDARARVGPVPSCAELRLRPGPACARALAAEQDRIRRIEAGPAEVARQLAPLAAGAEAAGLMASLPGALALALLAGGHIGGEWSGRTMKNLLTQHGSRWQVLAAKLASLWLAGLALVAVCWAALAAAGPAISRLDHLPDPHESARSAFTLAGSQVARSALVLAAFAVIGVLAAMLTRNTIGTTATTAGAFIAMLAAAALPGLGRWTPATWVQGWMGFPAGLASVSALPTNFWSRFISAGGSPPGHLFGLAGLAGLLVAGTAIAARVFSRADVSG
jgi:hypothetical protein